MSKRDCTLKPVRDMIFALPTDAWQLRLVPDSEHDNLKVLPHNYTKAQLLKSIGYLRHQNMSGYHIFGRPDTCRHILVDDLCQDALDQLVIDGLQSAFVVRTSKANHQAWITLSIEELDPLIAAAAARILAKRYDGDLGSTDAYHLGRLPGFTNRKDIYRTERGYPYTGLRGKAYRGVAPAARELLIEAEELAASMPSSYLPSTPIGGRVLPNHPTSNIDIDPSRSPMTPSEAREIYEAELKCQAERKGWDLPVQKGFRSDADYAVSYSLRNYYGFDPDDLAALLQYESEKASERGIGYVLWTVNAAL